MPTLAKVVVSLPVPLNLLHLDLWFLGGDGEMRDKGHINKAGSIIISQPKFCVMTGI